jgi:hypothetical protein
MEVEVAGVARFGVDKQASTTNVDRQVEESSEDVLEESDAEPTTLVVNINAEPGK